MVAIKVTNPFEISNKAIAKRAPMAMKRKIKLGRYVFIKAKKKKVSL